MSWATAGHDLLSLLTLLFLEVVLGIDNLVFISIASSRLPESKQPLAQKLGLAFALVTRLLLLAVASWIASLTHPIFSINDFVFSWRDAIMLLGGIFLIYKSTDEIHAEFTSLEEKQLHASTNMLKVIIQIGLLDIIFSLDSVITAIGMTDQFYIMAIAICFAILVMIIASNSIAKFINTNPTIKMLAISFILMVGMVLIADGFHFHIPRGYIYFSIAFSLFVESLNLMLRNKKRSRKKTSAD